MPMSQEDFRRSVVVPRGVGTAAAIVGGAMLLLLLRNLLSVWRSMDSNPGVGFWQLFWSTTGENGDTSPVLVPLVWGPPVLLAVVLVLVVIDLAIHGDRVRKVYEEYLADGWIGVQLGTGLKVTVGKATQELVVLTGPGFPAEQLAGPVSALAYRVNAMVGESRTLWGNAAGGRASAGFPADDLVPELPRGVLVCARRGATDQVAVINARSGGTLRILATRPNGVPVGA